ncbi:hypothetical protein HNR01_004286, partial [Methylorubrum rhodesianum]|nr:hypothetical protein [Methylorubrum rhodesianum]
TKCAPVRTVGNPGSGARPMPRYRSRMEAPVAEHSTIEWTEIHG